MELHDKTIGLCIFFPVLCTISVGLRLFVRTKLCKGAFGWDDIALLITLVGLILWVAMAWTSMSAGFETPRWSVYHNAKDYVCYVISGVVKISVALVLYRLDTRLFLRVILIVDMLICAIWTVVVTLIIGLGCTDSSPYRLKESVCQGSNYAQESSYVIFDVLHVVIPIIIVWGVQINGNLKWAVIGLFGVGLLAAAAAIMKLRVYIHTYNPTPTTSFIDLWYESMIWAVTEHGLSLFAASILAIRPFFTYISKSYSSLSFSRSKSLSADAGVRRGTFSSSRVSKGSLGHGPWPGMELGKIGVRSEVDVQSEYDVEHSARQPLYRADIRGRSGSAEGLVRGKREMRVELDHGPHALSTHGS